MHELKREYFIRFLIVFLFFVSCGVILGIFSLAPSYVLSLNGERDTLKEVQALQKGRQARGTDAISNELSATYALIKSIEKDYDKASFSKTIDEIASLRTPQIFYSSISLQKLDRTATSTITAIVQGKALTRDSLLKFKKNLESDPNISKVDLPVSDLAKSKDISFAVKFSIKK